MTGYSLTLTWLTTAMLSTMALAEGTAQTPEGTLQPGTSTSSENAERDARAANDYANVTSTYNNDPTFNLNDKDDNNQISRDEYYGYVSDLGVFPNHDIDADDRLGINEYDEIGLEADFDAWDVDRNHYLSAGEFYDGSYTTFDADENGFWDANEWHDAGNAGLFDF